MELPEFKLAGKTYSELHNEFAQTEYGERLAREVRFDRYRPTHVSKETWVELLGKDVCNLDHMPLTYGLARIFLKDQKKEDQAIAFNEDEERVILVSSMINDWHEAITGDINFELKTTEDEQAEEEAFNQLFELFFDASDPVTKNYMLSIERTIFDQNSKTGQAFNAIERIGYLRTAIIAFNRSNEVNDDQLANHLRWMAAGVLSNQVAALLEYKDFYPFVQRFLQENQERISQAFEVIDKDIFIQHGQTETTRRDLYTHNEAVWRKYLDDGNKDVISTASYDRGIFGVGPNFEQRYVADYKSLEQKVKACKELGLRIVLTSGSWDLKHVGHERYLHLARSKGDVLVVGVDSDRKVKARKGDHRPINPEKERLESLSHVRAVDMMTLKDPEDEKWKLIKVVRPDTLIVTQETYEKEDIEALNEYCGEVVVLPPQATTSTSAKLARFIKEHHEKIEDELDQLFSQFDDEGLIEADLLEQIKQRTVAAMERTIGDA